MNICSCCSGKTYDQCCKPFHEGTLPKRVDQLMRSRYTAYKLGLADYIAETTHPSNPQDLSGIAEFCKHTDFEKLELLEVTETTVTFTAHLSQGGQDATFTEKSVFKKVNGKWLYFSGEIFR